MDSGEKTLLLAPPAWYDLDVRFNCLATNRGV